MFGYFSLEDETKYKEFEEQLIYELEEKKLGNITLIKGFICSLNKIKEPSKLNNIKDLPRI